MHTAIINNELDLIQRYEYIESDITPLDLAIMIANQYAVLVLIRSEIQYDINDCLRTAIVAKRNGLAIFLLEQGSDPTFKDKIGRNSLHTAVHIGNLEIVKYLLDKGASVNAKNISGATALMISVENGDTRTLKLLLENGADIKQKNRIGQSAIDIANKFGHRDILEILQPQPSNTGVGLKRIRNLTLLSDSNVREKNKENFTLDNHHPTETLLEL